MTTTTARQQKSAKTEPRKKAGRKAANRITRKIRPGSRLEVELVEEHLPLVKTIVGRLASTLPNHVDVENLNSAGMVGLLNAIRNYDPACGSSFETYARVRIRGSVLDELRRMDWVPRSVHSKARKVQAAIQDLEQKHGEVPSDEMVAEELNISVGEYLDWQEQIRPATFICLDASITTDSEDSPSKYESFADDSQEDPVDDVARREVIGMIAKRLEMLPEMQRKVLSLYYFEDLKLREIAEIFSLTESRICQIHAQAILAIKTYLEKFDATLV